MIVILVNQLVPFILQSMNNNRLNVIIAFYAIILVSISACSQPQPKKEVSKKKIIVKEVTLTQTEIDNSMENFDRFDAHIRKNLKVVSGAHGEVMVRFTTHEDSSINNIEIAKSLSKKADEEVVRVVKLFPKWTPNTLDGKPIGGIYTLPVTFK